MKQLITLFLLAASTAAIAQPRLLTQAIVTTKTTIVSPEADEAPAGNFTNESGEQVRVMRFGGDGETKTTTWLKNDLVKTFSESEMGRTTVIRDNTKKLTTTIMEMMGRKSGFYATDEDQEIMRKRMDSMMQNRGGQNVSFGGGGFNSPAVYSIVYVDESKKISGYTCKKAMVISKRTDRTDTTVVWYCPDFKLQHLPSTGGTAAGFGGFNMTAGKSGMEDLNGFPMEYERTMNRGRKMTVQVTKLVIDKDVADKEFEIAKDIEIKPMKDMQNSGGPGFQMRISQ